MKARSTPISPPLEFATYEEFLNETNNKIFFENQIAWIKKERKNMVYKNNEWAEIKISNQEIGMTMYELAKTTMAQLPILDDLTKGHEIINEFLIEDPSQFYLFLCKEISYYTIFQKSEQEKDFDKFSDAVIACAQDIGQITDISYIKEQKHVEIWVRTPSNEDLCMVLFNCNDFIVTFGG